MARPRGKGRRGRLTTTQPTQAPPHIDRRRVLSQVAQWNRFVETQEAHGQQDAIPAGVQDHQCGVEVPNNQPVLQMPGRGVEEELLSLHDRVDPVVPGPLLAVHEDVEGWGEIDRLGVWECVLSPFQAMEEIPDQHRGAWALAMEKVHRRVWEAEESGEKLDRALKWWFFLPQALCRKAQRGGRAGVGQIKKRFNCVVKGDFAELVNLWLQDVKVAKEKEAKRRK